MFVRSVLLLIAAVSLTACSWVKVTEEGNQVVLRGYEEVTMCKKLGYTRSLVKDKIGFIERDAEKMTEELIILAKNEAAVMGGDTIVPRAPVKDGQMVFDIYRCKP
ncbi:DUF4156 domain-containing protein [Thiomicrorhabdus sp.]|uniref:DUF4156 domain-containing protein n=1 Tax=Thiomicrorhabdus sp. TaxID=2039724 RepID=UPI003567A1D8